MNNMTSLPSFGPGSAQESSCANRQADDPSAVERACAEISRSLKRFSDIVEADPTGPASSAERNAARDLNRALRSASQCRCQNLSDFRVKSGTHEALKMWFPSHDPRMHLFASNLVGELFNFLARCQAASEKESGPASDASDHAGGGKS